MKAYIENWYKTYEPAEGGYYVAVSDVEYWKDFSSIEEFVQAVKAECTEWELTSALFIKGSHYKSVDHTKPCDSDGYPWYNYDNRSVMNVEIPQADQDVWLINDNASEPAPTIYLGYR